MSKGNTDKCHDILDTHNFAHKDMVGARPAAGMAACKRVLCVLGTLPRPLIRHQS